MIGKSTGSASYGQIKIETFSHLYHPQSGEKPSLL